MSYFNTQTAWIPGLRTTSDGRASTYPLSQKAGRVTTAPTPLTSCLIPGVHFAPIRSFATPLIAAYLLCSG